MPRSPGQEIRVKVSVTYRDDRTEEFLCYDTPSISDWLILYGYPDPMGKKFIPRDGLHSVEYSYVIVDKEKAP